MFNAVSKIRERINKEVASYSTKKNSRMEEVNLANETELFLKHLTELSNIVCSFKNPSTKFESFREYPSIDEISFSTRENKYTLADIIRITGLKSIRHSSGWSSDRWEGSYREYYNLFETSNVGKANSAKSAILAIHTNISNNKLDYSNFTFRYLESITNICSIIEGYGISFIYEEQELFDSVFGVIGSIVEEYKSYTSAIKEFKKCQALEKIQVEREYINNVIKNDTLMLEFRHK